MEERLASPKDSVSLSQRNAAENDSDLLVSGHPTWSTRYKCFMAYLCLSLCYTNILRFSKSMGRYKIIILIPYLFYTIFMGIPALLVEIMLGRFIMGNVSKAWSMCPPARGVFWSLFLITGYIILMNYLANVFMIKYLISSFRGVLVWDSCDEPWSRVNCYKIGHKSEAINKCLKKYSEEFCHNLTWQSSGTQYWMNSLENKKKFTEVCFTILSLLFSNVVVWLILLKKIRSFEKVVDVLMYPIVILWIIFLFVSFRASNVLIGFKKLCRLNWSEIIKPKIWVAGLEDTVCLFGLGKLAVTHISSHGNFTDNILFDVLMVIFGSFTSCLLLGFPILNVIAGNRNVDDSEAKEQLFQDIPEIFISVSEALLFYPYPITLWSFIYYLGCFLASTSSQAILVLSFCAALQGFLGKNSDKAYALILASVSITFFVMGFICSWSFLQVMCELNHVTLTVVITLLFTITWQLFYGIHKLNYDFYFMMGYPIPIFIKITWISLPLVTSNNELKMKRKHRKIVKEISEVEKIGLGLKMYYRIPDLPLKDIVFIYVGIVVFVYLFIILIQIVKFRVQKKKISKVFMADPNWGPDKPLLKKSRIVFDTSTVNKEFMYRQELFKKPGISPPNFSEQNIVQLI